MTTKIDLIVFPGGFNLPVWVGLRQGYFQGRNIDIELHLTANSVEQMTGLIEGKYDIALTGFDNVVAYQEDQGEANIAAKPDLFTFMGCDSAFLSLAVQGDIRSYADLRGKAIAVDAMTTGFAFVLRKMLAMNGLAENDVTFERAGGVMQRFEGLIQGRFSGTLLITPFEVLSQKSGCRILQRASGVFPHYQGVVGAARRSWAARNGSVLVNFISAYRQSLRWLFEPSNRETAVALLVGRVPGMSTELARVVLEMFLKPEHGFDPAAKLSMAGMETVLSLRSEFAKPRKLLTDARKYIDEKFYLGAAQV